MTKAGLPRRNVEGQQHAQTTLRELDATPARFWTGQSEICQKKPLIEWRHQYGKAFMFNKMVQTAGKLLIQFVRVALQSHGIHPYPMHVIGSVFVSASTNLGIDTLAISSS